jgi:hypothetical protein
LERNRWRGRKRTEEEYRRRGIEENRKGRGRIDKGNRR